jgi:hypothetical protein
MALNTVLMLEQEEEHDLVGELSVQSSFCWSMMTTTATTTLTTLGDGQLNFPTAQLEDELVL